MGQYTSQEWYLKEKQQYVSQYGEIPPHWIIYPNTHPYSMRWRMGGGETFVMVFSNWFEDNFKDEKNKIDFFLKYPPPSRWMGTMASYLWSDVPMVDFEKSGYLKKIKDLGFEGTERYLADLDDPKWLES